MTKRRGTFFMIVVLAIMVTTDLCTMLWLHSLPVVVGSLMESVVLTAVMGPALYFAFLVPLHSQIKKLHQTEEQLKSANAQLKQSVWERNDSLIQVDKKLAQRAKELNLVELEKRVSQDQFYNLTLTAKDAILGMDDKGLIYLWNDAATRMFGYNREEALGKSLHQLIAPKRYQEKAEQGLTTFYKTGSGILTENTCEYWALRKDGTEFPVELSVSGFKNGDHWFATGIIRDITDRKEAEKERNMLAMAVHQTTEAVLVTDERGRPQYTNPAFAKITGFSPEEIFEGTDSPLKRAVEHHPMYQKVLDTLSQGELWSGQVKFFKKAGTPFVADLTISPIRDENQVIVNYVAVIYDVSQEIAWQQRQGQTQRIEALGTLAGGIAHDFNNVLMIILGFTELLLQERKSELDHLFLNKIKSSARRGADLVRQILTFARTENEELVPSNIVPVVKESLKLMRTLIPKQVELIEDISSSCPSVVCDTTQIHQIIINLCTNAYHSISEDTGQIRISLRSVELDAEHPEHLGLKSGSYLHLQVQDTGCGIPPENIERIFDPFFTTKPVSKGTGLGLAVVYRILNRHQGMITVDSIVGKGTTFHVYLPTVMEKPANQNLEMTLRKGNERILIVDDEEELLLLYNESLGWLGYHITVARNGEEAFQIFSENPDQFDLLFTDHNMPKMTGLELSQRILRLRKNLPVILVSGFSEQISKAKIEALGIKHWYDKPLRATYLTQIIGEIFDRKSGGVPD
ncbi:PAS domain S-box protein [Deltaproteobacteria bacterium TL4]